MPAGQGAVSKNTSQRNPTDGLEEAADVGLQSLKDNAPLIILCIVIALLVVLALARQKTEQTENRELAWSTLYQVEKAVTEKKDAEFDKALSKVSGQSSEPFVLLKEAQFFYEKGGKEDLQKSQKLLETFVARFSRLTRYHSMAKAKIEAIKAELADKASWMEKKKSEDEKADEKEHGDHAGAESHEGHGHAPGEHGKAPVKDAKAAVKDAKAPAKAVKAAVKDAKAPAKAVKAAVKDAKAPSKAVKATVKDAKAPVKAAKTPAGK